MKNKKSEIMSMIKKDMININDSEFQINKKEYHQKKKNFLDKVRSLKEKLSVNKKGKIRRSFFSKKFFLNFKEEFKNCKDVKKVRLDFYLAAPHIFMIISLASCILFSYYEQSHSIVEKIILFLISSLISLPIVFLISCFCQTFNPRLNYFISIKELKNSFSNEKILFLKNKKEYDKNKILVENLNIKSFKNDEFLLLDKPVSNNLATYLESNFTKKELKALDERCDHRKNLTYCELLRFLNYENDNVSSRSIFSRLIGKSRKMMC